MSRRTKGRFGKTCWATCLGVATLLVAGQAGATRAGGAEEAAQGVRAAAGSSSRSVSRPEKSSPAVEPVAVKTTAGKRDPFKVPPPPRLKGEGGGPDSLLPPGTRGLVIGQLKLEGIVREDGSNSMIAVVTGRTNLAYFLRVHDEVYNGTVAAITLDSIHFVQTRSDTGGRVETHEVVLELASQRWEAR